MEQPLEFRNLLKACSEFRDQTRDIRELQGSVELCISMITDIALNKLRSYLQTASGELEIIQFTGGDQRARALSIVDEIERKLTSTK